ncbi:hypothetical protein P3S67_022828 [Capsicum chacoense]
MNAVVEDRIKYSHGAVKTKQVKVSDIINLSSEERIVVEFDDVAPIGEAQGLLAAESIARRYVYNSISKKWGARRIKLWDKTFDPVLSRSKLMANVPKGISKDQWTCYVDYRLDKKTKKMCNQNAENRKKQTIPHIGGSKSNTRRRAEMMVEAGKKPGRATLYLATHKKEDGSYVNEVAKEICEKIELVVS